MFHVKHVAVLWIKGFDTVDLEWIFFYTYDFTYCNLFDRKSCGLFLYTLLFQKTILITMFHVKHICKHESLVSKKLLTAYIMCLLFIKLFCFWYYYNFMHVIIFYLSKYNYYVSRETLLPHNLYLIINGL